MKSLRSSRISISWWTGTMTVTFFRSSPNQPGTGLLSFMRSYRGRARLHLERETSGNCSNPLRWNRKKGETFRHENSKGYYGRWSKDSDSVRFQILRSQRNHWSRYGEYGAIFLLHHSEEYGKNQGLSFTGKACVPSGYCSKVLSPAHTTCEPDQGLLRLCGSREKCPGKKGFGSAS